MCLSTGSQATFTMHGNATVTAQFGCASGNFKHFYVTDLKTPIGTCSQSLLRVSDVIAVDCNIPIKLASDKLLTLLRMQQHILWINARGSFIYCKLHAVFISPNKLCKGNIFDGFTGNVNVYGQHSETGVWLDKLGRDGVKQRLAYGWEQEEKDIIDSYTCTDVRITAEVRKSCADLYYAANGKLILPACIVVDVIAIIDFYNERSATNVKKTI